MLCLQQVTSGDIMADFQWLVMAAVAVVAVVVTIYFGVQNLRNVVMQRERDSGYASGRVEAKLENLEQLLRVVNEKLDAHDMLLRQLRREAKKQNKRLRKLRQRVDVLESNPTEPPTSPPARSARVLELAARDSAAGRGGEST